MATESLGDVIDQAARRSKVPDYPLFDWIRFVLAAVVVCVHFNVIKWTPAGSLAVQCFFALSGWLIGGILLRTPPTGLARFFFKRASRIWIPYAAAIALLYGLSASMEHVTPRWLEFLLYDVTFTRNWFGTLPDVTTAFSQMPFGGLGGHFWTIGVEEQFYLLAPLIVVLSRFGRSPLLWGIIAIALIAFKSDFAAISLGVWAATLHGSYGSWHLKPWAGVLLIAVAAASAWIFAVQQSSLTSPILAASLILLAARPGLRTALGTFVGGISYPVYLNHWIGGFVAHSLVKRSGAMLAWQDALSCVFGILAGTAMYLAIDRVVMRRRASFYNDRLGRRLAIIAYCNLLIGLTFGLIRWTYFR